MLRSLVGSEMCIRDRDQNMYCEELDMYARCRNSKLVEQLGQVQYVLSDKTGTLTRNKMELLKCSIAGKQYGTGKTEIELFQQKLAQEENTMLNVGLGNDLAQVVKSAAVAELEDPGFDMYDPALNYEPREGDFGTEYLFAYLGTEHEEHVRGFLLALALCNTVVVEELEDGDVKYNAASPDDGALIKACKNLGVKLKGRKLVAGGKQEILLDVARIGDDHKMSFVEETYIVHTTIDFSSARKRMSLLIEMPDGSLKLMSKGADNVIRDRLLHQIDYLEKVSQLQERIPETDPTHSQEIDSLNQTPDMQMINTTQQHIDLFANSGLRTLAVAWKTVDKSMFGPWKEKLDQVREILDDRTREDALDKLNDELETDLELLGATAIEDKLQTNVGRSLRNFQLAGIRTWVLTGDKTDTAIQIGIASNLLQPSQTIHVISAKDRVGVARTGEQVSQMLKDFEEYDREHSTQDPALVIEGDAMRAIGIGADMPKLGRSSKQEEHAILQDTRSTIVQTSVCTAGSSPETVRSGADEPLLLGSPPVETHVDSGDGACALCSVETEAERRTARQMMQLLKQREEWQREFTTYCGNLKAVVCCRVSPKQKAEVTRLVKVNLGKTTLGVGDGANDVGMIKAADVGIGVQGVEGTQAVNNSDFSVCEFQHLENLLFLHGRACYTRISKVVCYFFYKNVAFAMTTFWWQIYCGFSGQLYFEQWTQVSYNMFFTSLPVFALGILDSDSRLGQLCPSLYKPGQQGELFNTKIFSRWIMEGVLCSAIFWFAWIPIAGTTAIHDSPGHVGGLWDQSTSLYTTIILTVTLRIALATSSFDALTVALLAISVAAWYIWLLLQCGTTAGVLSIIQVRSDDGGASLYWILYNLAPSPWFWLTMFILPVVCLLPAYVHKVWRTCIHPRDLELVQNPATWEALFASGVAQIENLDEMRDLFNVGRGTCYFTGQPLKQQQNSGKEMSQVIAIG
eukprot:TRINITY_DN10199_c0_g1_i2.p1 TRINITY_DN10199_c0_g1~~TRINITY_DN10199_c0_g1_i2.p1  ORF type:complete len:1014 (-),score=219.56 TRINITY_DN10199_c0_g1_i2:128-3037(-)